MADHKLWAIMKIIAEDPDAWANDLEAVEVLFGSYTGEHWEAWRIYEYAANSWRRL